MIRQLVQIQKRIVPDLIEEMQTRYDILHYVRLMQPIGRRTLATSLGLTERVLRREVDFLKEQGLLEVATQGMSLTDEGRIVLRSMHSVMAELAGISDMAKALKEKLGVRDVVIVPGDSDQTFWVQRDMGRATVARLKRELSSSVHNTIAVTGGTTMASVAAMMSPDKENRPMTFVPARGGLGETLELQANTVCSRMASRAQSDYHLLHIPDMVSKETFVKMVEEPSIKNVLQMIKDASIVVHGIGEAKTMAKRRRASTELLEQLETGTCSSGSIWVLLRSGRKNRAPGEDGWSSTRRLKTSRTRHRRRRRTFQSRSNQCVCQTVPGHHPDYG